MRSVLAARLSRVLFTLIFCLAFGTPVVARAQQPADDPFCASAPTGMLAALEGRWTLRQGAGFAVGGGVPIPLPAHPPRTLSIEYDASGRIAFLRGNRPDETMVMFATDPDALETAVRYLNDAEAEGLLNIGAGCDWYSLPLILGANTYALVSEADEPVNAIAGHLLGTSFLICFEGVDGDRSEAGVFFPDRGSRAGGNTYDAYNSESCAPLTYEVSRPGEGQMIMSLVVRFTSPSSGTGLLHFEGQMNGHTFGAKAPVVLSR